MSGVFPMDFAGGEAATAVTTGSAAMPLRRPMNAFWKYRKQMGKSAPHWLELSAAQRAPFVAEADAEFDAFLGKISDVYKQAAEEELKSGVSETKVLKRHRKRCREFIESHNRGKGQCKADLKRLIDAVPVAAAVSVRQSSRPRKAAKRSLADDASSAATAAVPAAAVCAECGRSCMC